MLRCNITILDAKNKEVRQWLTLRLYVISWYFNM